MLQTLSTKKVQAIVLAAVAAVVLALGLSLSAQQAFANPPAEPGIAKGETAIVKAGGSEYKALATGDYTIVLKSVKSKAKKVKVPNTLTINGKVYRVVGIGGKAFKTCKKAKSVIIPANVEKLYPKTFAKSKITKVILKTTKLTKKSVKNSMKGSKVKTVKAPKSKKTAYKKIFTKKNCGKKVKVK